MKSIIRKFVGAALLLALPLSFTSCEDILGKWDKPIPPAAITLKNALDAGAQVQISYKIGDTQCTATFLKDGDKYTLQGGGDPEAEKLEYDAAKNRLVYTFSPDNGDGHYPVLEVYFDINNTSFFAINYPQGGTEKDKTFDGQITIKGTTITIPNACPQKAYIVDNNSDKIIINYAKGETWNSVYNRFIDCGFDGTTKDNIIIFDASNQLKSNFGDFKPVYYDTGDSKVLKGDVVGEQEGIDFTNNYNAVSSGYVG